MSARSSTSTRLSQHGGLTGQEWLEYYVNNARFGTFTSQSAAAVVLASEEAGAAREDFQMLCHFVWRSPTKALQWSSMLDKLYVSSHPFDVCTLILMSELKPNHPHKEDLMYWQQLYKDRKSGRPSVHCVTGASLMLDGDRCP